MKKTNLEKRIKSYEEHVQDNLAKFYDHEAQKYTNTRKKVRAEGPLFVDQISSFFQKDIKILELGCGSGRLLEHLSQITDKNIDYTGVDISNGLLEEAKKIKTPKNIKKQFLNVDMITFLRGIQQESYDMIIGIASVQHLPTTKSRMLLAKYSYRALHYGGLFIMSNRSFSKRFIKKYRKAFFETIASLFLKRELHERNSFLLPRKHEDKNIGEAKTTFKRFYHIFTRGELQYITEKAGFKIKKLKYIDKYGTLGDNRKTSKNTLLMAEKKMFMN